MNELEQYIQTYFGISSEDLAKIGAMFKTEHLQKNDFYLKGGSYCKKLSFVSEGMLRIYVPLENKEVTQWISTKGYFVTDLSSMMFNTPARFTIQTLTNTSLYTIYKSDYDTLGALVPKWHELEKLFIAKCFTILEDRIFSHLSMTAEERYNIFFENNKELFNQVPLQYIASMLGMTPETFSRIRKKFLQ